jgi:tripartite-type tricarboxylate transporter receptor subunit TctC
VSSLTRRDLLAGATGLAAAVVAPSAQAQDYPTKPITLIVTAAAGGPGDTSARLIVDKMSSVLGQQIVIENVPGAGGVTGTARVARAAPDGYTLMVQQTGFTISPALYSNLPFDVEKDFAPIGLVNAAYSFLVGRKTLAPRDWNELLAYMKGPGKPIKFAHPGVGTLGHLHAVLMMQAFGFEADLIPYRGGGPAMNDIVGGHVDLVLASSSTAAPLIKAGNVKAYAYMSGKRYASIPDVPSAVDLGRPDLDIRFWHGMWAPAKTPQPVIDKINAALRAAVTDPGVLKRYEEFGLVAWPADQLSPAAHKAFASAEVARWAKVVRDNHIQIQN